MPLFDAICTNTYLLSFFSIQPEEDEESWKRMGDSRGAFFLYFLKLDCLRCWANLTVQAFLFDDDDLEISISLQPTEAEKDT